jgi:hypothetical protein
LQAAEAAVQNVAEAAVLEVCLVIQHQLLQSQLATQLRLALVVMVLLLERMMRQTEVILLPSTQLQ